MCVLDLQDLNQSTLGRQMCDCRTQFVVRISNCDSERARAKWADVSVKLDTVNIIYPLHKGPVNAGGATNVLEFTASFRSLPSLHRYN